MKYVSDYEELKKERFDTVEELEKAEAAVKKEHEAKQKAVAQRKAEAEDVKFAISERVRCESDVKKEKAEAYREYLKKCDELDERVESVRKAEREQLRAFCEKYPEGFHETIKIGDATFQCDYTEKSNKLSGMDLFDRLFNVSLFNFI